MFKYICKRVLYALIAIFVVSSAAFFSIRMIPGNPVEAMTEKLPEEARERVLARYGFDQPVYVQYKIFLKRFFSGGDLGESLKYRGRKVTETICKFAPVSGGLGAEGLLLGLLTGIPMGIIAAFHRGKMADYIVMIIAILGVAVPSFVLASCLQLFFAVKLDLFPVTGWSGFIYTVLPAIALSFHSTARYARFMRANCLDVLNKDYILLARAKGMSNSYLIRHYVLKNSIMPVLTLLGPQIALMFGGAFVVEKIFAIPGLGSYFVSSVSDRDYTMVMGQTVFISSLYIISVLVVDILYGFIDPRIRLGGKGENGA